MKRILAISLLIIIASCTKESNDKQTPQAVPYSGNYTVYLTNITYNPPGIFNDKFPGEITQEKDSLFFIQTAPSDSLLTYMPDTLKFVKNDSGYLAIYAIQIPEIETHGQIVAADTIVIVTSYLLQGTMSQTWIRNK